MWLNCTPSSCGNVEKKCSDSLAKVSKRISSAGSKFDRK
jgi:hypothetical protein